MKRYILIMIILIFGIWEVQSQDGFPNATIEGHKNLDFEHWEVGMIGATPIGFVGINHSKIEQGAQNGNFAVRISTQHHPYYGLHPGLLAIGKVTSDFEIMVGEAYDDNPTKLSGFIKYHSVDQDMIGIRFEMFNSSEDGKISVASADTIFKGSKNKWTYFEIPIIYQNALKADSIFLGFTSGNPEGKFNQGSYLELDNLKLEKQNMILTEDISNEIDVYPNPSTDFVKIKSDEEIHSILIRDEMGRLIKHLENSDKTIDISQLSMGTYFFQIEYKGNKTSMHRVVKH